MSAACLRTLSELLRSDARTRAELEARQGWVVNAARLAVAAPWLVLLLLSSQHSTVQAFDSAGGGLLLGDRARPSASPPTGSCSRSANCPKSSGCSRDERLVLW